MKKDKRKTTTALQRRGHRLKALAYTLESLAADARADKMENAANALRNAALSAAAAAEHYFRIDGIARGIF